MKKLIIFKASYKLEIENSAAWQTMCYHLLEAVKDENVSEVCLDEVSFHTVIHVGENKQ